MTREKDPEGAKWEMCIGGLHRPLNVSPYACVLFCGSISQQVADKDNVFWEGGSEDREISCVALGSHRAEDDLSQFWNLSWAWIRREN